MKLSLILLTFLVLTGCNNGFKTTDTDSVVQLPPQVVVLPTPTPIPAENEIQVMVDLYNETRLAQGNELILPGLNCDLLAVPNSATQIVGATTTNIGNFVFTGTFDQLNSSVNDGLNILPDALKQVYTTYFVVKCTGYLVVSNDQWHKFDLTSDDGSNLYVDGAILNNDGLHGAQTKSYAKFLTHGVHSFEVDFFQAGGSQELIVGMDGLLVPSANLYH